MIKYTRILCRKNVYLNIYLYRDIFLTEKNVDEYWKMQ